MRTATLAILLFGCGSGGGSHPDATGHADAPGTVDAPGVDALAVDAGPPDAAITAPLTVRVLDSFGEPLAGVQVILVEPDAVTSYDLMTDSAGTATHPMPAGSSATVVERSGVVATVATYARLRLGATVVAQPVRQVLIQGITFTWTVDPQMDQYQVFATCPLNGSTTSGSSLTTTTRVDCNDVVDAIVLARDFDNVVAPEAQIALDVTPPVDFGNSWGSTAAIAGHVAHVPTNFSVPPVLSARALLGPDRLATGAISESSLATDGTIVDPFEFPVGPVTPLVELTIPGPAPQVYHQRFTTYPAAYAADLDGAVLPWIASTAPDLASRTYAWTSTPPTGTVVAGIDAATVALGYSRTDLFVSWTLYSPAAGFAADSTSGSIVFPDLPGDLDFEPHTGDTLASSALTLYAVNIGADVDRLIERGDRVNRDLDVWSDPTLMRITTSSSVK